LFIAGENSNRKFKKLIHVRTGSREINNQELTGKERLREKCLFLIINIVYKKKKQQRSQE
jgi:hypothetical protein